MLESGMFNPQTMRGIVEQHENGQRDFSTAIWTMLMFDAFLRNAMMPSSIAHAA